MQIKLKSGLVLDDPDKMLKEKFGQWSWRKYDGDRPSKPNTLTSDDIHRAHRLGSRTSQSAYERLLRDRGSAIRKILAEIRDVQLEDSDFPSVRPQLVQLFNAVLGKGIGLAGATKLLSPFRPGLIPVLDSLVDCYYWYSTSIRDEKGFRKLESIARRSDDSEYIVELMWLMRADIQAARAQLDLLIRACSGAEYAAISRVRVVESLIWFYYARRGRLLETSHDSLPCRDRDVPP